MLKIRGDEHLFDKVEMPSTCLHRYRTYRPERPFSRIQHQNVSRGHSYYWAIEHVEGVRIAHLITDNEIADWRPKVKTIVPAYPRKEEIEWQRKTILTI